MCLAVPGRKLISIEGEDPAFRSGSVDFCGVRKTINLAFTPEVQIGDFVLVHVELRHIADRRRRSFAHVPLPGTNPGLSPKEGLAQTVEGPQRP